MKEEYRELNTQHIQLKEQLKDTENQLKELQLDYKSFKTKHFDKMTALENK